MSAKSTPSSRALRFADNQAAILRIAALAGLAISSVAQATPRTWAAAVSGAASDGTKWSPAGVPVAADVLSYGVAGSYAVSFNATVPSDAQNNFNAGTVSISASGPHTTTGQFVVGLNGPATVNLTSGAFSCGGTIAMASSANSGTMTVTSPFSALTGTNAAAQLRVGNGGNNSTTGTLNILNGGLVQSAGVVLVGAFGSSNGTVLVSGVSGTTHSRLITTDASAGDITLGSAGNGTMTVEAGGQVTCADQFSVGPNAGFTGDLSVGAAGAGNLDVTHDFLVGNNATAAASGTATVTVGVAGFVGVTGVTRLGDANGGSGTLDLSAGGQLSTGGLVVDAANGHLIHTAGTITIFGSPYDPGTPGYTLNGAGNPRVILSSNGTLASTASIRVGTNQSGTLHALSTGALITTAPGSGIELGMLAGGNGTLIVENNASVVEGFNAVLMVGDQGTGTLTINANGTVQATNTLIAFDPGSVGTATVNGANALLDTLSFMAVGGNSAAAGGSGSMAISGGGRVHAGSNMIVWPTGALTMSGSTLDVGGTLTVNQPTMTMTASTINASQFTVNNTDISASGLINARVNVTGVSTTITATGPLTMGNAAAPDGFASFGTLDVGAQNVTLLDSVFAGGGNIVINGGTLNAPGGTGTFPSKQLSGTGTVNAPYNNSGSITPTGAAGLTFNGVINTIGQGITGTRLTFGSGGGFTGAGNVNAQVVTLPGSTITATGPLTLGDSGVTTDLCTIGGTLLAGANAVQLLDAVRPTVTGIVELQGGQLSAFPFAAGVLLLRTGAEPAMLSGRGSAVHVIHNNGLVSPGRLAGDRTETLFCQDGYDQRGLGANAPGRLDIELEGSAANQKDLVAVTGTAFLAGTLLVARINGFNPTVGQQFTILTASSVSGTFSNVIAPGFVVIYSPTDVQVRFIGICDSADFNCDEDLGTDADIEAFFACLAGTCPGGFCHNDADFNNDGDIGTDGDIEAFFRVLGGGPCFP